MKKIMGILGLVMALGMGFFGCSGDDGGSSVVVSGDESASVPDYTNATEENPIVLRNKLVNFENDDVYYEYLKFTNADGGKYSLYKQVDGELKKQNSYKGIDLSSDLDFTYNSENGAISFNGDVSVYFFKLSSDVCGVAADKLKTKDENPSLDSVWSGALVTKIKFDQTAETCIFEVPSYSAERLNYEKDGSWLNIVSNVPNVIKIPLLFTQLNYSDDNGNKVSENTLFYQAFKTERKNVEDVGRAICAGNAQIYMNVEMQGFIYADFN